MSDPITARLDAIEARLDAPGPWIYSTKRPRISADLAHALEVAEDDMRALLAVARAAQAHLALCRQEHLEECSACRGQYGCRVYDSLYDIQDALAALAEKETP